MWLVKRGKAQVTVYIILGIIILFGSFTFYFIDNRLQQGGGEDLRHLSDAPVEVLPVVSLIEDCMARIGKDGIRELGLRGGYIYPERWGFSAHPVNSYEGNAVRRFRSGFLEIPYWYHLVGNDCSGDTCTFGFGLPLLHRTTGSEIDYSIEAQLDSYIEENMMECVRDFNPIYEMGFDVEAGEMAAETTVTAEEVIFQLDWPLKLQKVGSENEHLIDEFSAFVPVKLQDIYKHAMTITAVEVERNSFEWMALAALLPFTGLGENTIPPFSAIDFSLQGSQYWIKNTVQRNIEDLLRTYVPLLQYYNSSNYINRNSDDVFDNYYYNVSMNIPSAQGAHEYDVAFDFTDSWNPYVDLNCEGQACMGESLTFFGIFPTGMQRYKFYYNLSHPVLVSIYDDDGLDGEGYLFQFFLESNIRYNDPARANITSPIAIPTEADGTMLCSLDQRNTDYINITAYEEPEKDIFRGLEGVQLVYYCAGEGCILGNTGENGTFATKLPVCFDGLVYPYKEGYVGGISYLTTFYNESDEVDLVMDPIRTINVTMKKFPLAKQTMEDGKIEWRLINANPVYLSDEDYAIIRFERVKQFPEERSHQSFAILYGNDTDGVQMEIAPGRYKFEVDLFSDKPFVIPEDTRTYGDSTFDSGDTVTIPEMSLNESVPLGTLSWTEVVTVDEALESDSLELRMAVPDFYSVEMGQRKIEMLDVMGEYEEISAKYIDHIKPRWRGD